jgi:hypothetical protein
MAFAVDDLDRIPGFQAQYHSRMHDFIRIINPD